MEKPWGDIKLYPYNLGLTFLNCKDIVLKIKARGRDDKQNPK